MESPPARHLTICVLARAVLAHNLAGGMEMHAETLRRRLAARGHRLTTLTTPHPDGIRAMEDEAGETLFVGNGAPTAYGPGWWTASLRALLERHGQQPFDVVAGHGKAAYTYLKARPHLAPHHRIPVVSLRSTTG